MRLIPDSWGVRRVREFNDCNLPPGQKDGGRFGRNDDPRCKGGGGGDKTDAPRDRMLKGTDREHALDRMRVTVKTIRQTMGLPDADMADWNETDLLKFGDIFPSGFTSEAVAKDFGILPYKASDIARDLQLYDIQRKMITEGTGAWSDPEPVDVEGSGAAVREKLLELDNTLGEALLSAKEERDWNERQFQRNDEEWRGLWQLTQTDPDMQAIDFPRWPLNSSPTEILGRKAPLDDGVSLKDWLNDPTVSEDVRSQRAGFIESYADLSKARQEIWRDVLASQDKVDAAQAQYDAKFRKILMLPRSQSIVKPDVVAGPGMSTMLRDRGPDFTKAERFIGGLVGKDLRYPKTITLEKNMEDHQRAYASAERRSIAIDKHTPVAVIVHELAHHIEYYNPEVLQAAVDFRDSRTKTNETQRLVDLAPTNGYKDHEVVRGGSKTAFEHVYAGKVYEGTGFGAATAYDHAGKPHRATEVLTMGLQQLYESPFEFAREDPDWFDWTIDVLRRGPAFAMRKHKDRIPKQTEDAKGRRTQW